MDQLSDPVNQYGLKTNRFKTSCTGSIPGFTEKDSQKIAVWLAIMDIIQNG